MWAAVAGSVKPLAGRKPLTARSVPVRLQPAKPATRETLLAPKPAPVPVRALDRHGLDAGWDRRLEKGMVAPDFTLDLHGADLAAAHARLEAGVDQALACGARVVLLVTGRARPVSAADRGGARGAIRAKFLDWLAAGPHAGRIAAVRPAHPRHGGPGAVYIVLRRPR